MNLMKVRKRSGRNMIRFTLKISIPLRLDDTNFRFVISALATQDYGSRVLKQVSLREVDIDLDYKVDIDGQDVQLSYGRRTRRLT